MNNELVSKSFGTAQCGFVLVRSKRKGQMCGKMATKKASDGTPLCLVHWRMREAQDVEKSVDSQGYHQLQVSDAKIEKPPSDEEEVLDYGQLPKKKKKKKENKSYAAWQMNRENKKSKHMDRIDFNALERNCLDAIHKSVGF